MKKLSIVILCLFIALLSFIYVQKNKAEERITQLLHSLNVKFDSLKLNIFPTEIEIDNIHYQDQKERSISFQKLNIELGLGALVMGNLNFQQANFKQGKFWRNNDFPDYQDINIIFRANDLTLQDIPTVLAYSKQQKITSDPKKWQYFLAITGENRKKNKLSFETQIELQDEVIFLSQIKSNLHLKNGALFNHQGLHIEIGQARITYNNKSYQVKLEKSLFNKQPINFIEGELEFADSFNKQTIFILKVNDGHLKLTQQKLNNMGYWLFSGQNLPIEKLLVAFNLPAIVEGKTDITGKIQADKLNIEHGDVNLTVHKGRFKGLNLLELVASYLPINYDEDNLQQKELDTQFTKMSAILDWQDKILTIKDMSVMMEKLNSNGEGEVDLTKMQCDFLVTLSINQEQYQDFKLPIRFFDSCTSPQYKVEFNKEMRDSLKNILRNKLK